MRVRMPACVLLRALLQPRAIGPSLLTNRLPPQPTRPEPIHRRSNVFKPIRSAPYLTIMAPGVYLNGAGFIYSGTSQATPHVAGAIAVRRSRAPLAGGAC